MHVDDTRIGFANAAELKKHTPARRLRLKCSFSLTYICAAAQAFGFFSPYPRS